MIWHDYTAYKITCMKQKYMWPLCQDCHGPASECSTNTSLDEGQPCLQPSWSPSKSCHVMIINCKLQAALDLATAFLCDFLFILVFLWSIWSINLHDLTTPLAMCEGKQYMYVYTIVMTIRIHKCCIPPSFRHFLRFLGVPRYPYSLVALSTNPRPQKSHLLSRSFLSYRACRSNLAQKWKTKWNVIQLIDKTRIIGFVSFSRSTPHSILEKTQLGAAFNETGRVYMWRSWGLSR